MKRLKKGWTVAGAVLVCVLLLGGVAAANSQRGKGGNAPDMALSGSVASKLSYQGRLTGSQGDPLNGDYDMVFQIWDDATGGAQIGADIILRDVPVADGLFTVELSVPHNEIWGQALWLQVQVEGQVLAPRQELLPVPYALSLKPGAQIFGWSEPSLFLGSNVEDGVVAETDAPNKAGVLGHSSVGTGVRGYSPNNKGMEAIGYTGIYARSDADDGEGVHGHGTGERTEGVLGTAEGVHGRGVWGIASGAGPDAYGVSGRSVNADGVEGYTESPDRSGVFGHSDNGSGVYGVSTNKPGVVGETLNPDLSGIYGHSANAAGVRGRSEGNAGIVGWTGSTEASGVLGHSEVSVGVRGMSDAQDGVAGWTGSDQASGVYGHSVVGSGVKGESGGYHGVVGVTSSYGFGHAGVYGHNQGLGPAIWSQGDLYVTGAFKGNLPNEGGSFPRAAFDSGVQCIGTTTRMELNPGLPKPAYNPQNFVVNLQAVQWNGLPTSFCVGHYGGLNWRIYNDAQNTISVWRGQEDNCEPCFRLRVWYVR
jgi:hypothetical protein